MRCCPHASHRCAVFSLQNQYQNLLALANERKNKLKETVKAYVLVREAAELSQWIRDKVRFLVARRAVTKETTARHCRPPTL